MTEREVFKEAKVLLVDDNQINLFVLNKIFEQFGIAADCVPSGVICLKKAAKKRYDIIFMDHMMPELDGVETLEKLKEMPGFDTPVVVLTANYGEDLEKKYKEAGFAEYMMKPAEPPAVHEILLRYLMSDSMNKIDGDEGPRPVGIVTKASKLKAAGFQGIDNLVEAGLSSEEFEELLQIFKEESETKLPDCQSFADAEDLKNYAIIVHGLKNDAAMISEKELSEEAKAHEMESKAGNKDYVKDNWPTLKADWQKVIDKINIYFE